LQADFSDMSRSLFKNIKRDLRVVGVDDGAFPAPKSVRHYALLAAVLFQDSRILAVRVGRIHVDGKDANQILTSILETLRFDAVMLSGISFGGFNLVDIAELARSTRRPVIAITGRKPNNAAIRRALRRHFGDWEERLRKVRRAGRLYAFKPNPQEPKLYFEVKGASPSFARNAIASTATISRLPEPVRVAGILARGLSSLSKPRVP
jgi:endonuclease V-like protein UPF0215 family